MTPEAEREVIVSLDRVSVSFPVYQAGSRSLKKRVLYHGSAGKIGRDANDQVIIEALSDLSLALSAGDRVALIGANGAARRRCCERLPGSMNPFMARL